MLNNRHNYIDIFNISADERERERERESKKKRDPARLLPTTSAGEREKEI